MGYKYGYNKNANKKVELRGIPLQEFFYLSLIVSGLIVVISILSSFGIRHWSLFVLVIVAFFASVIILKKANKNDHPSFLLSFLSYKFRQPKRIKLLSPGNYEKQMEINRKLFNEMRKKPKKSSK